MFGDEMLAAPVAAPADKITGLVSEKIWLPAGRWIEWPTGKHLDGPAQVDRTFSIDQIPVYVNAGRDCPHAAAHALHRPKTRRSAHRECVASGARQEFQLLAL